MAPLWLGVGTIVAWTYAAIGLGAALSGDGTAAWYARHRPRWAPPLAASGPVWLVLAALLATSTCLTWLQYGTWEFGYLAPFAVLTIASASWPVLLFAHRRPGRAAVLGAVVTGIAVYTAVRYRADTPIIAALTLAFAGGSSASTAVTAGLWWVSRRARPRRAGSRRRSRPGSAGPRRP